VAEQHLDDAHVGPVLQQMRREAVSQPVDRHLFAQAGRRAGRTASGVQYGGSERPVVVTAGKQPTLRPGEPPVAAQNPQQLRREHDVTVLAALALLDPDHHPLAVDVRDLQQNYLRHAQSGGIDRRQRGAAFEAWNCLQEAHDLVGA
jgi:hypothetical protein